MHYKVCDDGIYSLIGENNSLIHKQNSYVPDFLAIDDDGYGDYIILKIDENGFIQNWDKSNIDFEEFMSMDFNND